MRPGKTITACAVTALAMVFSVQQGEHGPLVTYKLEVPKRTAPAAPLGAAPLVIPAARPVATAPEAQRSAGATQRLSPLKPTILGTVVMPVPRQSLSPAFLPPSSLTPSSLTPSPLPLQLLLPEAAAGAALPPQPVFDTTTGATTANDNMVNEATGEVLTLDEVTEAVEWRRDTVERLNTTSGAFGF